jgi:HAD superfamily hydrolase (TIGR01490 family)
MTTPRGAAFFDLDRTLIAGSANFALAVAAFRSGLVGPADLARDAVNAVGFVLHGADDARSEALRDRILRAVAGREVAELDALGDRIVPRMAASVFSEARRELELHARAGRDRVIVSASPQEIVAKLADELGLEGAIGTRAEVLDGRYTGSLAGPFCYGDNKPVEVRRLAAERGYDLSSSSAYSDAASDLPFLECVGEPVAMNPDAALRSVAAERGWRTVEVAAPHRAPAAALGRVGRHVHRVATQRVRGRQVWT